MLVTDAAKLPLRQATAWLIMTFGKNMKNFEAILSATAIDKHGEMMARSALESAAKTFETHYLPIGVEHDPRNGPIGRMVEAWIEDRPDGISVLKGRGEIFESTDELPKEITKTIVERSYHEGSLVLSFDRTYREPELKGIVDEISNLFGSEPRYEVKKAVEPLSILYIGGAFVLGGIANGFLGQIGADVYSVLKQKLVSLLEKQREKSDTQLLVFEFTVTHRERKVLFQTILTDPTETDISDFLNTAIYDLDDLPIDFHNPELHLSRVVFFLEGGRPVFKYAVRTDGYSLKYEIAEK